jgi:hypothetical protein
MVVLVIAVAFALTTVAVSVRADARFKREQSLPMQWTLSRSKPLSETVVWAAPRRVALGLIPCLAVCSLALFAVAASTLRVRPGQEGYLVPALLVFGSALVGAQALHLSLIARTLRQAER